MKYLLLMSVAPIAFNSAPLETVTVVGQDGEPLRINKTDYEADQAPGGAKKFELHTDEAPQANGAGVALPVPDNITQPAAPAAPDFTSNDQQTDAIDPHKNAAVPPAPSIGQKLVQKEGEGKKAKFFVVTADADGTFPKLTGVAGIDEAGYATDREAWNAIMALPS